MFTLKMVIVYRPFSYYIHFELAVQKILEGWCCKTLQIHIITVAKYHKVSIWILDFYQNIFSSLYLYFYFWPVESEHTINLN